MIGFSASIHLLERVLQRLHAVPRSNALVAMEVRMVRRRSCRRCHPCPLMTITRTLVVEAQFLERDAELAVTTRPRRSVILSWESIGGVNSIVAHPPDRV